MVGFKSPALRDVMNKMNDILGKTIGATKSSVGIWRTASGQIVNPTVGATNLLKGLAISGINSAAILTPVIAGIRALTKKIRKKSETSLEKQDIKSQPALRMPLSRL